jgi:hypothetical protein
MMAAIEGVVAIEDVVAQQQSTRTPAKLEGSFLTVYWIYV